MRYHTEKQTPQQRTSNKQLNKQHDSWDLGASVQWLAENLIHMYEWSFFNPLFVIYIK